MLTAVENGGAWEVVRQAGRGQRRAVVAVFAPSQRNQPREEGRAPVACPDEDEGTGHRGAHLRGRTSRRETHSCGRGSGLVGDREWRALSGYIDHVLLVMRLSGGLSGLDGIGHGRSGMGTTAPILLRCQASLPNPPVQRPAPPPSDRNRLHRCKPTLLGRRRARCVGLRN